MYSLKEYNSFGINAFAKELIFIHSESDLVNIDFNQTYRILGGGSNVLLVKDLYDRIIVNQLSGIHVRKESEDEVLVFVASGVNWHSFVLWAIEKGYSGIENLSLIPGSVGAAPVQNIGAYGVEIKDVLQTVEGYTLPDKVKRIFSNQECEFGYRSSLFKSSLKSKFFITGISLKLSKNPNIKISYGSLKEILIQKAILSPTIKEISDAVIEIRQSKLPDPKFIGNAGSFFKNGTISIEAFEILKKEFPEMPGYPDKYNKVKLSSGWLIEQCGWKGKQLNQAGCYEKQALVLINLGEASGEQIIQLAQKIQQDVLARFGIQLEPEVNIWD